MQWLARRCLSALYWLSERHTFRTVLETQGLTRQGASLVSRIPWHRPKFTTRLQLVSCHKLNKAFSAMPMMFHRHQQHQGRSHRILVHRRRFAGAAKKGKLLSYTSEHAHAIIRSCRRIYALHIWRYWNTLWNPKTHICTRLDSNNDC